MLKPPDPCPIQVSGRSPGEANPDNGTAVAYMKFNPDDMEASEMCVLVVIKVEEGTFVFEMTSPITAGEEDMLVYQKMFSDL